MKSTKPMLHAMLLMLLLLPILTACGIFPAPSTPTTPPAVPATEAASAHLGQAAFCDVAAPIVTHGGRVDPATRKFNVSLADVVALAAKPATRMDDVRVLIGDTTPTLQQVNDHNAKGQSLCGWPK